MAWKQGGTLVCHPLQDGKPKKDKKFIELEMMQNLKHSPYCFVLFVCLCMFVARDHNSWV